MSGMHKRKLDDPGAVLSKNARAVRDTHEEAFVDWALSAIKAHGEAVTLRELGHRA